MDIPIKVINPSNKCEYKTYMLSLQLEKMETVKPYDYPPPPPKCFNLGVKDHYIQQWM